MENKSLSEDLERFSAQKIGKRRIFISGIAGFLGSHLADSMLSLGHEVVGNDTLIGGYKDNVPAKAEFHLIDSNDLPAMKRISKGANIIYDCAAIACEGLSVFSPALINRNVYMSSLTLMTAAAHNKVRRYVYCSSMARYGDLKRVPFTEDMECQPYDPYGLGKYAAELQLRMLSEVHGFEPVIAVPHNIIGPRQKYDDPYRNVASIMINLMLQGRQPIIYGDGDQKRCFSFIQDVTGCLVKMGFQENVVGEAINIGPDEEDSYVTVNKLAAEIADILNFDLHPVYLPDRPREVRYAHCSADKARRLLGYKTQTTLREGLSQMIERVKARGPKPFEYHLEIEIDSDKTPAAWKNRLF